jgi:transcription elongation factor GreA
MYITREDKERLEAELKERVSARKQISARIEAARELGDLKENAEYHAAREDQGLNERKIRELEERLKTAVVTDSSDLPDDLVFLGATVRLRNVKNGREELYRLVGEATGTVDTEVLEVTPGSPLGEALIKTRVGDTIRVSTRRGEKRFEIVEIMS